VAGSPEQPSQVWYDHVHATMRCRQRIARDVQIATGLPMGAMEMLATIAAEPQGRLRMSELARTVLLSRAGVTRQVERLEAAGLVDRFIPPDDRRATYASITPRGRAALARGEPALAVRRHYLDRLDDDERRALETANAKILPSADGDAAAGPVAD
jgi:DNA-binding MarR family transcriptional regulator